MRAGTYGWLGLLLLIAGIITAGYSKQADATPGEVVGVSLIIGGFLCFIRSAAGDD